MLVIWWIAENITQGGNKLLSIWWVLHSHRVSSQKYKQFLLVYIKAEKVLPGAWELVLLSTLRLIRGVFWF